MLLKSLIGATVMIFSLGAVADTSLAEATLPNGAPADSLDTCLYNNDQFKFNAVNVGKDGSETYVLDSYVVYYMKKDGFPPKGFYKGNLVISDDDGDLYEICAKADAHIGRRQKIRN